MLKIWVHAVGARDFALVDGSTRERGGPGAVVVRPSSTCGPAALPARQTRRTQTYTRLDRGVPACADVCSVAAAVAAAVPVRSGCVRALGGGRGKL